MCTISWTSFGGITLLYSSVITISFQKKVSNFGQKKKSFHALVETIGMHSNPGISFMSLAVKGMIRIANEESNCLSSLVILTMPLITMLIKEVPDLECRPIVPTKAFFWPKSETFFWNEIVITEEWKRVMPPNYVHKIVHISALFYQSSSDCIW